MGLDLFLLALGGAMLYFGAEWLVQGAAGLAVRLGVRPLLIGLTVVSYATSAPELAVSISAGLKGQGSLVLGNVFGSNIANVGLILGLTALIAPPKSDGSMAGKELVILGLASAAIPIMLLDGRLHRTDGILLILGAIAFTWITIRWSKQRPLDLDDVPHEETRSKLVLIGIAISGLTFLIGGGEAFVRGSVSVAKALGVDERIIGLTVVAFGTSVPELAASIVAAVRGHSDLAIGNVIGSNIFNLLLVLGTAGAVAPFATDLRAIWLDLSFLIGLTTAAGLMLWWSRTLTRVEGGLLLTCYGGFLALLAAELR